MAEEGSGARVVRNTIANGLGRISAVLISLVLTPFLIHGLGFEAFGVWAIALSFSFLGGYASLTDLGVEAAAARYIAEARSDRDTEGVREAASSAMAFFGGVALVAAPALAALAFPIMGAFDISEDLRGPATACLALIGGQLLFELPARTYFAALEGAQRYGLYQLLELLRAAAQAALFVLVLVFDLGVAGLGGAVMLSSLVVLVAAAAGAHRVVPEVQISRQYVSRRGVRRLITFGGQYFFLGMMGTLYRQIDRVIIGVALGARFVTGYEVANRIHAAAVMAQSIASSALLTAAAYLRKSTEVLRELYLRGTNYTLAISLPVTIGAFIFAEDLIRTWLGEELTFATGSTQLFLTYLVFVAVHATGSTMLIGLGHMRFVLTVVTVFSVVNLVASIALVKPLGVDGVILGLVIGQAVIWLPYTRYFFRIFDVSLRQWLREVIVPNLPGVAVQVATAPPLLYLSNRASNLVFVGLIVLVSIALSIVTYLTVGLRRDQRLLLSSAFRDALGRGSREPAAP